MTVVIVKEGQMPAGVRDRMIAGAVRLLARGGPQATTFSTVLAETDAPRGSIYHHFPGGKDELVLAAIAMTEAHALSLLDQQRGVPALEVARSFLAAWRSLLTQGRFSAGCALVAVTVGSDEPELRARAAAAFRVWHERLSAALTDGGLGPADANAAAAMLLAASEGAVVISRAEQDIRPFDLIADQLLGYVAGLAGGTGPAAAR
jgi:TetR/AcrR family transcriptional repressor of lmrAB and yxaGH operons